MSCWWQAASAASTTGSHVDHPGAAVKIVRVLAAAATALVVGIAVQLSTAPAASATSSEQLCATCWWIVHD